MAALARRQSFAPRLERSYMSEDSVLGQLVNVPSAAAIELLR
jgi:hypothetical protein